MKSAKIKSRLKLLLPIMFPNDASFFPSIAEKRLTMSSGMDVPKATTVSPMARLEIPFYSYW